MDPPEEQYVDLYEAAAELGVSIATVWNLLKRFAIVRYKLPGQRRTMIRRQDLAIMRQPMPRAGRPRGKVAA